MSNVTYQVERIEGQTVYLLETLDLTKPNGPGILMRDGKPVDCKLEGITSATRRITMTIKQAIQHGFACLDG